MVENLELGNPHIALWLLPPSCTTFTKQSGQLLFYVITNENEENFTCSSSIYILCDLAYYWKLKYFEININFLNTFL